MLRTSAVILLLVLATASVAACVPDGPGPTTTVDDATCQIERRTIETALAAYDAELRRFPVLLQDLVDEGYLERYSLDWVYSSDTTTYSLTGPC